MPPFGCVASSHYHRGFCPRIIVRKELFHNHFQKCCDPQSSAVVIAGQSVAMPSSTSVPASGGSDALTASDAAAASARATMATAATASPLASAAVTTTLGQSSSSSATKPTAVLALSTATEPARTAETARMAAAVNPHVGAAQITAFVFTVPAATKSYGQIRKHLISSVGNKLLLFSLATAFRFCPKLITHIT